MYALVRCLSKTLPINFWISSESHITTKTPVLVNKAAIESHIDPHQKGLGQLHTVVENLLPLKKI